MTFKNKEFVTFDCYGTLINWEVGIIGEFTKLVASKNLSIKPEDLLMEYYKTEIVVEQEQYRSYKEVLRLTVRRVLENHGLNPSDEDCEILVRAIPTWQPFPEVKPTLQKLKEKGYKLVILSNIDEDIIQKSIENIGVEFSGVVTAEQVKSYKPAYGHWQEMLKRFNTTPEKVLHVGASYFHDVIPAKTLGFNVVLVNRGHDHVTGEIKPDQEFNNLAPLDEVLPNLH